MGREHVHSFDKKTEKWGIMEEKSYYPALMKPLETKESG
jgi:hypothetical protein